MSVPAGFDELIHPATRLSVVALLAATEWADFAFVRDSLSLSDSALSKQLHTLAEAGYLELRKEGGGRRRRTNVRLTDRTRRLRRARRGAPGDRRRRRYTGVATAPAVGGRTVTRRHTSERCVVEARGVTMTYGGVDVLRGVDLDVHRVVGAVTQADPAPDGTHVGRGTRHGLAVGTQDAARGLRVHGGVVEGEGEGEEGTPW
ncbi:hypothetical protein STENM327S_03180 [Streptomyces tendae]